MTQLVEDITIKITLNHCEGDSQVMGGQNDLRFGACEALGRNLEGWIESRAPHHTFSIRGLHIKFENTGLYEAPEVSGGDN